jgi:hypothetical protein
VVVERGGSLAGEAVSLRGHPTSWLCMLLQRIHAPAATSRTCPRRVTRWGRREACSQRRGARVDDTVRGCDATLRTLTSELSLAFEWSPSCDEAVLTVGRGAHLR